MNVIFQADLSPAQEAQILAGNALRLLGLDEASLQPQAEPPAYRAYMGPKIDVHAHLHADNYRFPIEVAGADVALAECRRYNIEIMIASSAPGIFYDMQAGNREIKAIIDAHPQFRGYVVTNPNFLEESCVEMDTYYQFDNFVGAKIHCEYSHQPTAGPRMRALFAEIAKRGKPVKIHNDGPGWVEAIRDLARAHPHLPIIIAHGGPMGTGRIVADVPNVYLEFCGSGATRGVIRDALEAVGPERLMFGTDQDLLPPGFVLGTYYDAGFTPEQAEMVMYSNAQRLFGF
jgi:predicted TIM-barrel fold metal-dependent hydrolase